MRVKLACTCLIGAFLVFASSGSANIQQHTVQVPLRASLIEASFAKFAALPAVEKAVDKLASLPSAAESFFHDLGAPEIGGAPTPHTNDAPQDLPPPPPQRARTARARTNAPAPSADEPLS